MAEEAKAGTRLTVTEIHANILEPGLKELARPAASLLWSSLASGLVIGFSFVGGAYGASLAGEAHKGAAFAAIYPIGFILVIMARSELFTENTLVPVIPFLERRDSETFLLVVRVWVLLLLGNLVGAAIFSWMLARTPMVDPALHPELLRIARDATMGGFGRTMYAGVFAGWLLALLSWVLAATSATGAQIALIWFCTAPIAALQFRHAIAGSTEAFYRAAVSDAGWGEMLTGFVAPAALGNAIGGVLLVALLNYGQVEAERKGTDADEKPKRSRKAKAG